MAWWESVYRGVNVADVIYTPGRGMDGGSKRRPFSIFLKETSRIIVRSGSAKIPLVRECFDAVEEAFANGEYRWLRIAASHASEAFENSADRLIRERTGSSLARGNYVCALLEHCRLARYSMREIRKSLNSHKSNYPRFEGQPHTCQNATMP